MGRCHGQFVRIGRDNGVTPAVADFFFFVLCFKLIV